MQKTFLKLIKSKKDKSVILKHVICVVSSKRVFSMKIKGKFNNQARGKGLPSDRVIKLGNSRYTIAECQNMNKKAFDNRALWKKVYK